MRKQNLYHVILNFCNNKCAQSNLGTGRVAAGCSLHQQWAVAFIHKCASCPSAAAAAVSVPQAATFCCVHLSFGRRIVAFLLISHKPRCWSWNRIYRQKAHESSFPTIRLPNGNVVKFLYTHRKHFTPNPTTCLIPEPVRPTMPNGIRIRSAVSPQCTV